MAVFALADDFAGCGAVGSFFGIVKKVLYLQTVSFYQLKIIL